MTQIHTVTAVSAHFTLEELTHSDAAAIHGIDNSAPDDVQQNLVRLTVTVLEPARAVCGVPFEVSDGYRCPKVNALDGGVLHSQHEKGEAADVVPRGLALPAAFDRIRRSDVPFDQIILESGCIHLSCAALGATPRREALVRRGSPGHWTYIPAD